jgi:hypothetical protein
MSAKTFTDRQGQFLAFIDAYSDEAGRGFRFQAGHCSDVKPATIPI